MNKKYHDIWLKNRAIALYCSGLSIQQVAEELNISEDMVRTRLQHGGVPMRPQGAKDIPIDIERLRYVKEALENKTKTKDLTIPINAYYRYKKLLEKSPDTCTYLLKVGVGSVLMSTVTGNKYK